MNRELTFGGHPVEFKVIDDEVYITCKGVTGTLTQVENFLKQRGTNHKFGKSKIRFWRNGMVKIDCLEDTKTKISNLAFHAKKLKKYGRNK